MNEVLKKLHIKPPHTLLALDAPDHFAAAVASGEAGCAVTNNPGDHFDSIHWFVKTKADVDRGFAKILGLATPGLPVWVYYPKGSSGIQTDLTRDTGWDTILLQEQIRRLTLVSFDNTWSAFCFRLKTAKDLAEEAKPREERVIFQYADAKTKTITLPDDVHQLLTRHPAEKQTFDALSFSHQREYLEWIVTAKQLQTREKRLRELLEKLTKPS